MKIAGFLQKTFCCVIFPGVSLLLFRCSEMPVKSFNIEVEVNIILQDKEGRNLVSDGKITASNMQLYHVIDGKKTSFNRGDLDYPRGYALITGIENPFMRVFPNTEGTHPVTLIEYPNGDIDTLQSKIIRGKGYEICTEVVYNGLLKWAVDAGKYPPERGFILTKDL